MARTRAELTSEEIVMIGEIFDIPNEKYVYKDASGNYVGADAGGGTGTVTSVAISGSDGLEVDSGSPITTNGTIALGVNKTAMLSHLNVEDGADVTDATNVASAGAFMKATDDTDDITEGSTNLFMSTTEQNKLGHITVTQAVDLDQMETDIAALANGMVYKGNWDASAGTFPGAGVAQTGWFYTVSVGGTVDAVVFVAGDKLIAITDNASTTTFAGNWTQLDATDAVTSVNGMTGNVTGLQEIATVISGNTTASNDGVYVVVASATFTDPSPVEGKGFTVIVRNGTATVGGTPYAVAGSEILRIFHSGAWANYLKTPSSGVNTGDQALQSVFDNGQTITVANTVNRTLTINQNDTTNNPTGLQVTNTGTGVGIRIDQTGAGTGLRIDNASTQRNILINQNANYAAGRESILMYSNTALTTGNAMQYIYIDNASSTIPTFRLRNDGTGPLLYGDSGGTNIFNINANGSIELGHASDTTISRVSAGVVAIEGVNIVTESATQALTNKSVNGVTLVNGGTATKYLSEDGTYTTPAGGSGGGFWTAVPGSPTRTGNTTFTLTDTSNANLYDLLLCRGTVLKRTETSTLRQAMVVSATYSTNVVTVTIIGDTMASIDASSLKYGLEKARTWRFAIAGTIGATGTNLANTVMVETPAKIYGCDFWAGTAGSGTTTLDINKNGTTMFATPPSILTTGQSVLGVTADTATTATTGDFITIDIDATAGTTKIVDAYVNLFRYPLYSSYLA